MLWLTRPLLALLLLAAPQAAAQDWRHITSEDGIAVTAREVPGRGFPTFRGTGTIDASLWEVLAVLSDVSRHKEWMFRCAEARQLRKISEMEYIVYSRTDAPWPVSDRDAVFHSTVHPSLKDLTIDVRFEAVQSPLMGPVKGVVRMTKLRGHYRLKALGENKTLMDYQADADPGGMLPGWLAKLATRRLPLDTIRSLRKRVKVTRGWYNERIKRWQMLEQELRKKKQK
jgi:hypothetical protein